MGWWKEIFGGPWFNHIGGNILKEGSIVYDVNKVGFLQWRVKTTRDEESKFVSLQLLPSFYHRGVGGTGYYVNLDLEAARRSRDSLNEIIKFLEGESKIRSRSGDRS